MTIELDAKRTINKVLGFPALGEGNWILDGMLPDMSERSETHLSERSSNVTVGILSWCLKSGKTPDIGVGEILFRYGI